MAVNTPEGSVFLGREGTGAAQIFGNPYDVVGQFARNKAHREAVDLALARQNQASRDKRINDLLLTNPEKTFEPFNKEVINAAEKHRSESVDMFNKGMNPVNNPGFEAWNKKQWDEINDLARRGNFIKDQVTLKRNEVAKNPYLDQNMLNSAINDTYMDHEGNGKDIKGVDLDSINKVIENNPQAFKSNVYADDFLKNLGDKVFNFNKIQRDAEGVTSQDVDIKMKKGIYRPDPNAADGILRDPKTGNPVINATPEVVRGFMADPYAANWVHHEAANTGKSEKKVVEDVLEPKLDVERKQTMNFKYAPLNMRNEFGLKASDEPKATRRLQNVDALVNAFTDKEGYVTDKPNEKAIETLGYLKNNAKFGNADVIDAKFVKGNDESGSQVIDGVSVPNQPHDRIVLFTKQGQRGRTTPRDIDLTDQHAAAAQLNSIFETAKTEGGFKVGFDVLRDINEGKFNNQYLNSERKIQEGSFDEKKMFNQISNWKEGNNLSSLVGKKIGGRTIKGASHVTPFFGSNYIKVEFTEGKPKEIKTTDSDDTKLLKEAYESGLTKKKVKLAGTKGKDSGLTEDFWNPDVE